MLIDIPITFEDKYNPCIKIKTKEEAKVYFEFCVLHTMLYGVSEEEARRIEKSNIGYYAGYYSPEDRARVEELFDCEHPYFGKISERGQPTPEEALEMGRRLGEKLKQEDEERKRLEQTNKAADLKSPI